MSLLVKNSGLQIQRFLWYKLYWSYGNVTPPSCTNVLEKKSHKYRRTYFGNIPNHLAINQKRSSEEQLVLRTWILWMGFQLRKRYGKLSLILWSIDSCDQGSEFRNNFFWSRRILYFILEDKIKVISFPPKIF